VITIGIIGASGQVGTEVCLFLKTYPGVRPIGIVRTPISGALLRRLNVDVRVGTFASPSDSKELVGDCDLVVDFSAPSRGVEEIKMHYLKNISSALEFSPRSALYIFISTINAFGMSARFNRAKYYWIPRSAYAHTKRYGERLTLRLGRKLRKEAFVFRLGHVHGLLQRVSNETAELVRGKYERFEYPNSPSHTIFCASIAEGIIAVAEGKELPGIYTLLSEPPWSWKEVLEYYSENNRNFSVTLRPMERQTLAQKLLTMAKGWLLDRLLDYKDTLNANVLRRFPRFERKCRVRFNVARVQREIREFQSQLVYRPTEMYRGIFPGARLSTLSDSRSTMHEKTALVNEMLEKMLERVRSGASGA
jgi:nucleoside-diphosphate-sugar epimerase